MTGQEAIAYIHSHNWRGSRLGLERTEELLARVGNPEKSLPFVHIAGTNGKGSTAAGLASVLQAAGYRTGLYTSPYLFRFHERIRVDGVPISDADLGQDTARIAAEADAMAEHPTEFELVTCVALVHFHRMGCDAVVLEVGMGGRLDSTNAIPVPEAAVITRIGLDHTAELGGTAAAIAAEKAGIIKPGCAAILYHQEQAVETVVRSACETVGAALAVTRPEEIRSLENTARGQRFTYGAFENLTLPLLGVCQLENAAVVLETVLALRSRGWTIPDEAVGRGMADIRWPGRFEVLGTAPWFITDGGHNPQCAQTVADNLAAYFPGAPVVFLLGVLADKDYDGMLARILPLASHCITVTPDNPRALSAEVLAAHLATRGVSAQACDTVPQGVAAAIAAAGEGGVVCSMGSLYLTGAVRACFGQY